jgi:Phosphate-selective porin O and P.
VFAPINTDAGAFLFGGDVLYLADTGGAPNVNEIRMRERIEVRIDPTRVLDTGALANVNNALVLSAEAAATVGSFHARANTSTIRSRASHCPIFTSRAVTCRPATS